MLTATPSDHARQAAIIARACFALIPVWTLVTMLAHAFGPVWLYAACDLPYFFVCHRLPERVLAIGGVSMPLCSRCAGLWLGMSVAAALAWPALPLRALRVVLVAAAFLLLAELVTQDLGLHPVWHATRVATGLLVGVPFGGALGALVTREGRAAATGTGAPLLPGTRPRRRRRDGPALRPRRCSRPSRRRGRFNAAADRRAGKKLQR